FVRELLADAVDEINGAEAQSDLRELRGDERILEEIIDQPQPDGVQRKAVKNSASEIAARDAYRPLVVILRVQQGGLEERAGLACFEERQAQCQRQDKDGPDKLLGLGLNSCGRFCRRLRGGFSLFFRHQLVLSKKMVMLQVMRAGPRSLG